MNIIGKEVKFKDKYDGEFLRELLSMITTHFPYGGPIADGKVTDLEEFSSSKTL